MSTLLVAGEHGIQEVDVEGRVLRTMIRKGREFLTVDLVRNARTREEHRSVLVRSTGKND